MCQNIRLAVSILLVASATRLPAQDLTPRAYLITPLHGNAVTLTWSFFDGGLNFNGAVPVTGATGTYSVPIFSYYHSLNFFGRSSNITASLPYGVGTFSGTVLGTDRSVYRSGLLDFNARFSVNLLGGPAMELKDFLKWKQKVLLGASIRVVAPTGQYDPTKLINWSINRWAFKPELGYSQRWGQWVLDGYAGVWFYTTNSQFYSIPAPLPQTHAPIGSLEAHLSYNLKKYRTDTGFGAWVSLDGNFWWGGTTALNNILNPDTRQTSSRLGATASFTFSAHQTIKVAFNNGDYVRFGGNYKNVSVAWQYSWLGHPR